MAKFYLKDWHGKEKEFTDEKIFVRGEDGELIQFTQGAGASPDVRYVTFMSYDGLTEYGKKAVAVGDDCADPIARGVFDTPTRESNAQYNYTFYGWATTANGAANSNWNKAITEDKVVYANFAKAVRHYIITYYDSDGTTVLKTESVAYGSTPSYTPSKDEYDFAGWQPSLASVTGNASYTATWTPKPEILAEGTCGDNAKWTVTTDGRLIISGTGATYDYALYPADGTRMPWIDYRETAITSIVIEPGITHIGTHNFSYHSIATGVSIPSTVTSIGTGAFCYCQALTSVSISEGVQSIGETAFEYCSVLSNITIPASVNAIESYAFKGHNMTSIVFVDTEGWYCTGTKGATSGTPIDLTDPAENAREFSDGRRGYLYWYKS